MNKFTSILVVVLLIGVLIGCGNESSFAQANLVEVEKQSECEPKPGECPLSLDFPKGFDSLDDKFGHECVEETEGKVGYNSGITAECICCDNSCKWIRTDCSEQTDYHDADYGCIDVCCSVIDGEYCLEAC